MGRSFLMRALHAAAILLAAGGDVRAQEPASLPVADPAGATVVTGQDSSRRITLPIHIDGKGPFNFIVDTGSERTVISRELARKLALAPDDPVTINSVTGKALVDTVIIPRLSYGHGEMPPVQAPVLEAANLGAAGLLGLDGLESKRLVIDFRTQKMEISDSRDRLYADRDAIIVRARRRFGQLILVDSEANGEKIHVILDTGAGQSIGNLALLRTLTRKRKIGALRPIAITSVTGDTIIGGWNVIGKVRIGGLNVNGLAVVFTDISPFRQLGLDDKPALLLGMDALRQFERVSVDFGRKQVHFLLPDGAETKRGIRLASR